MGRFFSFIMLMAVIGAGAYIYMRQAQSATVDGAGSPQGTVDIVGVKRDLMVIARAERMHSGMGGKYVSLDELRSSGDLSMDRSSRGPYTYSVDVSDTGFRVTATNSGPSSPLAAHIISVNQDLEFSEEH